MTELEQAIEAPRKTRRKTLPAVGVPTNNEVRGLPPEERFWLFVMPEPNTGCWLWAGGVTGDGYGALCVQGSKRARSHRFSYELFVGPIPDGMLVCHRCDVRSCVNPDHLFLGTFDENMADMVNKGRQATGLKHGRARLSRKQVREIFLSNERICVLARRYGVHDSTIDGIRHRGRRRNVTDGLIPSPTSTESTP